MTLRSDARTNYDRDGYYLARQLASAGLLDAYVADINAITIAQLERAGLRVQGGSGLDALYANLRVLHAHDQSLYLSTLVVCNRLKSLFDLFLSADIADACRSLGVALPMMHTLPLFHIMSNGLKIAGGYHGFDAHQDWTGLQTSLNAMTVWIPFHDIDDDCFPLEVLPGSHVDGLFPGRMENNDYRLDEARLREDEFVRLWMNKGDVIFMTPFTVHRTGLSSGDALRIAASWRYEDVAEETFVARRYPFAQKRIVNHELLVPGFPTAQDMKKLFGRT